MKRITPAAIALFAFSAFSALGAACAAPRVSTTTLTSADVAADGENGSAYRLVMHATSCWMDGLWSDALGETGDARAHAEDARCERVLFDMGGQPAHGLARLRAMDESMVNTLAGRITKLAVDDSQEAAHAPELVTLLHSIADEARETMHAQRAADAVKYDVATLGAEYTNEKAVAAPELRDSRALHALFRTDFGMYTPEAHTIGLLFAVERMDISRGLSPELRSETLGRALHDAIGGETTAVPDDAPAKLAEELHGSAQGLPDGTGLKNVALAVAKRLELDQSIAH